MKTKSMAEQLKHHIFIPCRYWKILFSKQPRILQVPTQIPSKLILVALSWVTKQPVCESNKLHLFRGEDNLLKPNDTHTHTHTHIYIYVVPQR